MLFTMVAAGLVALGANAPEILWEMSFDQPVDSRVVLHGEAQFREGALATVSRAEGKDHDCAAIDTGAPLPEGAEPTLFRLEWTLTPVRIGGWGSGFSIPGGPVVVEITGPHPTLNAKHAAKSTLKEGEKAVISCEFNRFAVFSWRINGEEQLDAPVPAWQSGAGSIQLSLCDYKESKSETRWHGVRLERVLPADPLPALLSAWDYLDKPANNNAAPFLVGVAGPMTKVFREAADFSGRLNGPVRIAAAGRERESFQLVCIPAGRPVQGMKVSVSSLLHQDGKTTLSADRISWHPVGYVQTKKSNSSIYREGWWWPDVLLPPASFDAAPGMVQPVWFTVDVPADTPAGTYRGVITLADDSGAARLTGLELEVRPFNLPLRGALKTAFCISPGLWEMWYQPEEVKKRLGMTDQTGHGPLYTSNELEGVLPHEKWLEMYDFLLAHRLSPTVIYSGLKNGKSRTVPGRADMEYCYERGMNATCLANCDVLPGDPAAADRAMADLEAWLRDWEGFVSEKNWPDFTWYVHGFDESEMRPNPAETVDPAIRRVYGMIGEKFPWCKRETANPFHEKHKDAFDIWTPLTSQLGGDLSPYRERQAAGRELWAYVCCGPGKPYANLFIDFPGVDPRILGWQYFQHHITGFLYYLINLYEYQENWNMAGPKWPEVPWNPLSFKTNSDGILMYPGPDATPLASIRMENLRDGIEDYEALALLKSRVDAAATAPAALLEQAGEVLAVRREVSKSWTEYTQEPAQIEAARAEVDRLIGAIDKAEK